MNMKLLFICLVSFLPNVVDAQSIVYNLGLDSLNFPCIIQTTFEKNQSGSGSWSATAGQHVDRFNSYPEALAAAKLLQSKLVSDSVMIRQMMDDNLRHLQQLNSIIAELNNLTNPAHDPPGKMRIDPGIKRL